VMYQALTHAPIIIELQKHTTRRSLSNQRLGVPSGYGSTQEN
jgi:hypothetical protein